MKLIYLVEVECAKTTRFHTHVEGQDFLKEKIQHDVQKMIEFYSEGPIPAVTVSAAQADTAFIIKPKAAA
jgi:hypothetical protein